MASKTYVNQSYIGWSYFEHFSKLVKLSLPELQENYEI